eukprot:scaffold1.g5720.t1
MTASTLLAAALDDVLVSEAKGALPPPSAADLDSYERHWAKLPGAAAGTVACTEAELYFSGELLQGEALARLMAHVVGRGGGGGAGGGGGRGGGGEDEAESISREQFFAITHLVYACLRRAQDRMFAEDFAVQVTPTLSPKKAAKHIKCDSIASSAAGWRISAGVQAAAAPGPLQSGVTGAPAAPVGLLTPSLLDGRPLERGLRGAAADVGGVARAEEEEVSAFEARLSGLMQQLAEQREVLSTPGGAGAGEEERAMRLARLEQLEAQVRRELGQEAAAQQAQQQRHGEGVAGGTAAAPLYASWQAFGTSSPSAALAPAPADAFAIDAFGGAAGAVGAAAPGVAVPRQQQAAEAIIGEMLEQLHLSPAASAGGAGDAGGGGSAGGSGAAPRVGAPPPRRLASASEAAVHGLEPMSAADRERCEASYVDKGYERLGGMPRDAAAQLYARAALPPPLFAHAWALADADADGRLSRTEFCVFMSLLRMAQKGQPLPLALGWEAFAALLGPPPPIRVDAGRLRGALHRSGGGVGRGWSAAAEAEATAAHEAEGGADSDADSDCFESITTLSVGSSRRSAAAAPRRSHLAPGVLPGGAAGGPSPSQAERAERVRAWAATDPDRPPHTGLEVGISRADVRYAKPLDRPFFTISVRDHLGRLVELPQDTPPGHYHRDTGAIVAGHTVALSTPLQALPPGSVLYVEIKHWKSAEKKFSTLAWGYAPLEALVDAGPVASRVREGLVGLHLCRKPLLDAPSLHKARRLGAHPDLHLSVRGTY